MKIKLTFIHSLIIASLLVSTTAAFAGTTYNKPAVLAFIPGFSGGYYAGARISIASTAGVVDQYCVDKGHSYSSSHGGMEFLQPQNPWGPYNVGTNDFFAHSYSGGEYVGNHMSQTGGNAHPVLTYITCES